MTFLDELRAAYDDRSTVALAIEHDLEPIDGAHAPVAPPTYASEDNSSKEPVLPVSPDTPLPEPNVDGWLSGVRRDGAGGAVTAPSVVLDSVAAQSGRAEAALWELREELGGLPAFVVTSPEDADRYASGVVLSSWQAAHRHVDAWFKYAAEQSGAGPLWAEESPVQSLLARINTTSDAREAFAYAPNSMMYGFWLSYGAAQLHRQPRVYRSEIVGYGAHEHRAGTTKSDPVPASRDSVLSRSAVGLTAKNTSSKKQADLVKPSELGFGLMPQPVRARQFSCERIAARASVSLSALRRMRYGSEAGERERRRAGSVALMVLALAGDVLGRQDTLLRSGCDLMPVASRWGWRVAGRSAPVRLALPEQAVEPEWWGSQLQAALDSCREYGLEFAEPVQLQLSRLQQEVIAEAVRRDAAREHTDEGS